VTTATSRAGLHPPDLSSAVRVVSRFTFHPLFAHARPKGLQLRVLRAAVETGARLSGGPPLGAVATVSRPVPGLWVAPADPTPAPPPGVLVYLHSGGYVAGSPRAARSVAEALGRRTGMPVLVPAYRRAPEHPFPAALHDCLATLRHLQACGVAADRIAVAGDSAGAHLALTATAALITRHEPVPAAIALFSPIVDPTRDTTARDTAGELDGDIAAAGRRRTTDPMLPPVFVRRCAEAMTSDPDSTDPRVNVLACPDDVLAAFPPVLSQCGSTEDTATGARYLTERLTDLGVPATHRVVPGQVHGFVALHRLLLPARDALNTAADVLAQAVRRPGAEVPPMPTDLSRLLDLHRKANTPT
jgi:monoterpene epsilon-lactone hydrolase